MAEFSNQSLQAGDAVVRLMKGKVYHGTIQEVYETTQNKAMAIVLFGIAGKSSRIPISELQPASAHAAREHAAWLEKINNKYKKGSSHSHIVAFDEDGNVTPEAVQFVEETAQLLQAAEKDPSAGYFEYALQYQSATKVPKMWEEGQTLNAAEFIGGLLSAENNKCTEDQTNVSQEWLDFIENPLHPEVYVNPQKLFPHRCDFGKDLQGTTSRNLFNVLGSAAGALDSLTQFNSEECRRYSAVGQPYGPIPIFIPTSGGKIMPVVWFLACNAWYRKKNLVKMVGFVPVDVLLNASILKRAPKGFRPREDKLGYQLLVREGGKTLIRLALDQDTVCVDEPCLCVGVTFEVLETRQSNFDEKRVQLTNFQLIPRENEEETFLRCGLDAKHTDLLKFLPGAGKLVVETRARSALDIAHALTGRK